MLLVISDYSENLLAWDGVAILSMATGYDIDFATIIRYEIHKRVFGETTTLPFSYLVQLLCDEPGVLDIPRIDVRVEAWAWP